MGRYYDWAVHKRDRDLRAMLDVDVVDLYEMDSEATFRRWASAPFEYGDFEYVSEQGIYEARLLVVGHCGWHLESIPTSRL